MKNLKYLTLSMLLNVTGSNAEIYSLDDLDTKGHADFYNTLPSVEHSDELLKSRKDSFEHFLTSVKGIVLRYEMQQEVGLRLIHNHYNISDSQIMVEKFEEIVGIPSLVTSPCAVKEFNQEALPTGWIFSSSNTTKPNLFEASTDGAVRSAINKLSSEPEFIQEMGDMIRQHQFEDLIALGILSRDGLTAEDGDMFLEINSADEARSIVQVKQIMESPMDFIKTSWNFKGPTQHGCLKTWGCVATGRGGHVHAEYHW